MQDRVMGVVANSTYRFLPTARAGGVTWLETLEAQALLSQSGDFLVWLKRREDATVNRSVVFTTNATRDVWERLTLLHICLLSLSLLLQDQTFS